MVGRFRADSGKVGRSSCLLKRWFGVGNCWRVRESTSLRCFVPEVAEPLLHEAGPHPADQIAARIQGRAGAVSALTATRSSKSCVVHHIDLLPTDYGFQSGHM